jgi:CMP-N-acetylneuraminic acid synthetase
MEILAIIPARSGSKGLPHKNIKMIDGKPMIAYSIELALASNLITRVIVSTDSEHYMEIAKEYGAETPFVRPTEFARDDSLDIDVFYHALSWLRDNEGYVPEICVQLRPCGPVRDYVIVDKIIQHLIDNPQFDSMRAVMRSTEIPYKMWFLSENGVLSPVMNEVPECYNMLRQSLPQTYFQNGYVDAVRPNVVFEQHSMNGANIGGYIIDEYFDIDYPHDVALVESCIKIRKKKQSFLVDVEGILIDEVGTPLHQNLALIKNLKASGHSVFLRCLSKNKEEIIEKLGNLTVDGVVEGFIETDYFISIKAIGISNLLKIIGTG